MMIFPRTVGRLTAVAVTLSIGGLLFGGCSTGKPRPARIKSEYAEPDTSGKTIYLTAARDAARPVDSRSYRIGERAEARINEPLVEVKNFTAGDRTVRAVVIADLKQTCGTKRTPVSSSKRAAIKTEPEPEPVVVEKLPCKSPPLSYLDIPAGRTLHVAGGFEEAGEQYYLLAVDTPDGTLFLATDRMGRLKRPPYAAWREVGAENVVTQLGIPLDVVETIDPLLIDGPVVRYETEEVVLADSANYVHFELDYAGMSDTGRGRTWHLQYKEFRRSPVGSPIYTKRLDYTEVGSSIELLGLRIQVDDVSPSRIVYTVLSD